MSNQKHPCSDWLKDNTFIFRALGTQNTIKWFPQPEKNTLPLLGVSRIPRYLKASISIEPGCEAFPTVHFCP